MKRIAKTLSTFSFPLLTAIMLVQTPVTATAQSRGAIHGQVVDAKSGEALPGANVQIQGTLRGSSTDLEGFFDIEHVQPGTYTVRVSFIGYQLGHATVEVMADSVAIVDFKLEPSPLEMAEVVVTASREPEEIRKTVVSVSALTSETALRRDPLRLDAALESIPGVSLMGENVNVRNSTGYTRGLGSRVLILIDSVPVLISDLGSMNWDMLPVTDFERVEVIKGPASALYGSYALGGVINIITKAPQPQGRFSIRTSAGIYDKPYESAWHWTDRTLSFNRTDLSYSKQFGKLGLRVSLGRHESTGDRQNRHFKRWNATGKLTWTLSDKSELSLFGVYARDRRGEFIWWDGRTQNPYLAPAEFLANRLALDAYTLYGQYRLRLNDWMEMKWRASYVRQLTGNQFKVAGDFQPAQGAGANWQIQARLDEEVSFTAGMEYHYDFAEQRQFGRHFAYTLSPYFQQVWQTSPQLRITAGLRYDQYYLLPGPERQNQFIESRTVVNPLPEGKEEQYLNPQIGLSYEFADNTVIHAALARGIRIPALGERFLQFDTPLPFRPNTDIVTERSLSLELGLRQRFGNHVRFEISGFHNSYDDLIEPVLIESGTGFFASLANIPRARITGVETSARIRFWHNRLGLEASATWTEPVVVRADEFIRIIDYTPLRQPGGVPDTLDILSPFEEGNLLSYRPRWIAFVQPSVRLGRFALEADYAFATKLKREQLQLFKDDQRVNKHQLDVRLIYQWGNLTTQLVVRNILQYNYTQVERLMNEVRNFSMGLKWEY